jgi:hypothetical protein
LSLTSPLKEGAVDAISLLETKELVDEAVVIKRADEEAGVRRLVGAGVCTISEGIVTGVVASTSVEASVEPASMLVRPCRWGRMQIIVACLDRLVCLQIRHSSDAWQWIGAGSASVSP